MVMGDASVKITSLASLSQATATDISFLNEARYKHLLSACQASAIVLRQEDAHLTELPRLVVSDPYAYYAKLAALLNPISSPVAGIAASAVVDASAHIPSSCSIGPLVVIGANVILGENVDIGSGCVIENDVSIGQHTRLESNVTIKHHCSIGQDCHVYSGAVIGADGFGYALESEAWLKIPQLGRVLLGNNVDVGANTTIDRGALDDTLIGDGVKLDNLIQIGHNCQIGEHTAIAACVAIAGSSRIGKHCRIGGAAMVLGHLEIVDGVTVSAGSMITRSLLVKDTYTAIMPFQSHEDWLNNAAQIRQLDNMAKKIKNLEKQLALLKSS
ncbi:MAG: UDP-3-O-(3-hydroxymyristoyl)glucosamine N-acyltransferase [Methylotenera sp.]|nr:UDP-3-O-(3-hydroxymyristoyl)glucosamine N-acyltransferase [Methylotenera sp.]